MSAGFTKGPWEAAKRGDYGDFDGNSRVILGDDMRVAVVQHFGGAEQEANAHLIANAPNMIAALDCYADQLCEGWCEQSPDCANFEDCAGCLARRVAAIARNEIPPSTPTTGNGGGVSTPDSEGAIP